MEEARQELDNRIKEIGASSLDSNRFIELIRLLSERIQLIEGDRSLKPFSETVRLLGLDKNQEERLVELRNKAVHGMPGLEAGIRANENWIREVLIPSVLEMDTREPRLIQKTILNLRNIGSEYGYQVEVGRNIRVGRTYHEIDVLFESDKIRAVGEITKGGTSGAQATGIRQLMAYMDGLDIKYGVLVHETDHIEEMEHHESHILVVGFSSDMRKVFDWLDDQASYIRKGTQYEIFDWTGRDFDLGRQLALYWIEILTQIISGDSVIKDKALVDYARDELGLELSLEAVRELYRIGGESQGLFYRMGFDGREETWASMPKDLALERLTDERHKIKNLTPKSLVGRWVRSEVEEEVTLVPTSSMNFENQVLILRAYVVLSQMGVEPVHYMRVMAITNLARTQVSGVNAFFVGLGFLEIVEKGTYIPATQVVKFYTTTPGEEDYTALQALIKTSSLYDKIRSLVLVHGSATEDDLIDYLLEESGETTKSRAKRALDWLVRAGLVSFGEDGKVQLIG